ncbi:unnamed protein product [Nippostrongylus brasiliensis]|uniref:Reverse transcriptase domain-containing protein n=1 Tax=Nippostrongylus brasiliensis TaxID=27835 RepID=A0A0N4XU90_NIPBR|nr:unnamed protein product [Nippostrongylus brasiliensis]
MLYGKHYGSQLERSQGNQEKELHATDAARHSGSFSTRRARTPPPEKDKDSDASPHEGSDSGPKKDEGKQPQKELTPLPKTAPTPVTEVSKTPIRQSCPPTPKTAVTPEMEEKVMPKPQQGGDAAKGPGEKEEKKSPQDSLQKEKKGGTAMSLRKLKKLKDSSSTRATSRTNTLRNMDRKANHLEFTLLNKLCRQRIAGDHQDFARRNLLDAAVNRASLKKAKRDIAEYRHVIPCLKAPDGSRQSFRAGMEYVVSKFYTGLYKSNLSPSRQQPAGEEVPSILPSEVRSHAIESMPRGKAPGTDKLSVVLLQACGDKLYCALANRFTKGDKEDLENYRPITLLPVLYKLFTRCILARIRGTPEEAQPIEQAGFRKVYSTLDHILTCCRLIEVAQEYHKPLVLTFVDYKKAFVSVKPAKVWEALEEQGVETRYTKILQECYTGCHTVFRPFCRDVAVAVERGVRQGDPISPCLFSACLESTIRRCDWEPFGVEVNGVRLNHLRFADDIVLVTKTPEDALRKLNGLDEAGKEAGLTINTTKTKVLRNSFCSSEPVLLEGVALENVEEYFYLGRLVNMKYDLKPEIERRKRAGWAAYNSIRTVLERASNSKLCADLFNSTDGRNDKQLLLRLHNDDVRAMTKVRDIVLHADEAKHHFAGHVIRRSDGRRTSVIQWRPYDKKRPRGRPPLRRQDSLAYRNNVRDDNSMKLRVDWRTAARDRSSWRRRWDPRKSNRRAEGRVVR